MGRRAGGIGRGAGSVAGAGVLDCAPCGAKQLSARVTLAESLRALGQGLREPRFYMALVLALVVWTAAYQNKRDYKVEVADLVSNPYLSGFNDVEKSATDPSFLYRWSKGSAEVDFPGIGNQPVQLSIATIGARPVGEPPLVTFTARGQQ